MIKRFDRLDVATSDLDDAGAIYERIFGFRVHRQAAGGEAVITIGDAQLRLLSGPSVAQTIAASGEGLAALWLETDDVDRAAAALASAGVAYQPPRVEAGRRIVAVDPKAANQVTLYIFDRRG